ncbi:MAG: 30S ribosomal protein S20, partial [Ruminococcus sp.]|nr:30S ribosomal protein S20 [Ruminococcus sp.]
NIKSDKKRVKVIATKTARNKAIKSDLKTALKKADAAVAENADNKVEVVRAAIKKVDMAASKGIMHKNKAARKKSQLALKLN